MTSKRAELKKSQAAAQAKAKRNRTILFGVAGLIFAILVGVIIWVVTTSSSSGGGGATVTPPNANSAANGIIAHPGKAKKDAPVVDLYFDYQCGGCHQFEKTYGPVLEEMSKTGDIQLVYHTMIFQDKNNKQGLSTQGAVAATCADQFGVYPEFHLAVFQAVGTRANKNVFRDGLPQSLGISGDNLTKFQTCIDKQETLSFVEGMEKKAYENGITQTPTLMVNSKQIDNKQFPQNPADLKKIIETLKG